jgi:hypothetical protein
MRAPSRHGSRSGSSGSFGEHRTTQRQGVPVRGACRPRISRPRPTHGRALVTLLLGLLLVALLGLALWAGLERLVMGWGEVPVNITIDGEPVVRGLQLGSISEMERLALVLVALVLLLVLALLLPVLLVVVVAVALAVLLAALVVALGAPAIAAASAVLAIGVFVVAPIVLLARLLRRLLSGAPQRPAAPPAPAPAQDGSATIKP